MAATENGSGGWLQLRQGIASATIIIILANVLSKVVALGRDILIAKYYGASDVTDAFYVALVLPALLASALGESFGNAVVPVSAEVRAKEGEDGARKFFAIFFQFSVLVALVCSAALALLAGPLVRVIAPGLADATADLAATGLVVMAFWSAGQILVLAITGIFHSRKNFLPPAVCQLLHSAGTIALIPVLFHMNVRQTLPFSWLGGNTLMTAVLLVLFIIAVRYRPVASIRSPHLRPAILLMIPIMIASMLHMMHVAIDRFFAASLPEGSIASLTYAFQLMNVPLYFAILPASQAVLPYLSDAAQAGDRARLEKILGKVTHICFVALVPVFAFTATHALPLIRLVYQRGAFDEVDALMTALALTGYAFAILPLAATVLLGRVYYALRDARTVVFCLSAFVAVKIGASLLLVGPLNVAGLALATALGTLTSVVLLVALLHRKLGGFRRRPLWGPIVGSVACSAAALGALHGLELAGAPLPTLAAGCLFVVLYPAFYLATVPGEMRRLRETLQRRKT
ncbi:MAG: murein biosynthesis integral membrane protein MurJ [Planctomycetota bacterium]